MDTNKLTALGAIRLFEGLPAPQLKSLAEIAQLRGCKAGETLFEAGQPGTHFFAVVTGKVRVFRASLSGKEQILSVFTAGESFAEVPVFEGKTYPASAQALEDSVLLTIPRRGFVELLRREPELALGVMALLSSRLRAFVGQIAGSSPKALDTIDVDEAIQDYADMLGVSPRVLASPQAVAQIRQARAQDAVTEQRVVMAERLSKIGERASDIHLGKDQNLAQTLWARFTPAQ